MVSLVLLEHSDASITGVALLSDDLTPRGSDVAPNGGERAKEEAFFGAWFVFREMLATFNSFLCLVVGVVASLLCESCVTCWYGMLAELSEIVLCGELLLPLLLSSLLLPLSLLLL